MYNNNKRIIPRKVGKPNKYFAKKTVAMGLKFDSRWEAERWGQLKAMERAGVVDQLDRQITYLLEINGHKMDHQDLLLKTLKVLSHQSLS